MTEEDLVGNALKKVVINSSCGKLNIKKHLIDTEIGDSTIKTPYHIYLAEQGKNTVPYFLFSEEELLLGNMAVAATEIENHEFWFDDMRVITYCATSDKYISSGVKATAGKKDNDGEAMGMRRAFHWLKSTGHYKVFKVINMYDEKSFINLTKQELNAIIKEYILNGYTIDGDIYKLFLAGLVSREMNPKLMKYVPHGIIIKNPKTGVSSISMRVGQNVDQATFKTLEGYADAEGNMFYSPLHNTADHINFDEVLFMPEMIIQRIFTYMECGQFKTLKGGRTIDNIGCARLTFTINPPEMERRKDGSLSDYTPYVFERFKNVISKLTSSASAALSRFAFVIFDTNMQTAERVSYREDEEYEEIGLLVREILKYLAPTLTKYIKKFERWLNKPIKDYNKKIDLLLQATDSKLMKEMWEGQKDAYRHNRGYALFLALIAHIYELLRLKLWEDDHLVEDDEVSKEDYEAKLMESIQNMAEEELVYVCERNLQTLRNLLEVSKKHSAESMRVNIENASPEYVKAILHAYGKCHDVDKPFLTFEDLKRGFHQIPDEKRKKLFNTFAYWSAVERKINPERLQKLLFTISEISMEFTTEWVFKRNDMFMDAYKKYEGINVTEKSSMVTEVEL